jgi:DNA-binding LacI/PurR family transcriptional regulator
MTNYLTSRHISLVPLLLLEDGDVPLVVQNSAIDGVIVRGATDVSAVAPRVKHLPCVWLMSLNRLPPTGDQVADDTEAAGQMAAEYLLSRGCKRAAVINHDSKHPCYQPRAEAFAKAFTASGGSVKVLLDEPLDVSARKVAAMRPKVDGLFVPLPDGEFEIVYRTLMQGNTSTGKLPLDLIGCAHDPARLHTLDPRVATVDIRAEELATAAIEMLLWRLRHPRDPRRRLTITPKIIEGAATLG